MSDLPGRPEARATFPPPTRLLLDAIDALEAGRRADARASLDRAIAAAPASASVRVAAAWIRFALRDHQRALDELARAAAISPGDAVYANSLVFELGSRLGWFREAMEAIDRCIAKEPRRAAWHAHAANLLFRRRSFAAALGHVDRAIAIEPRSASLFLQRANALCGLGRDGEAAQAARDALDRSGDAPAYRMEASRILTDTGAIDEAEACLAKVVAQDPRTAPAHAALGQLRLWAGDDRGAEAHADAVLAIDPGDAAGHRLRGAARVLRGDHAGALAPLDTAIRLDPGAYEAHVWRGEARLALGDHEAAYADIDRGILIAPGYLLAGRILRLATTIRAGAYPLRVLRAAYEEMIDGVLELCPGSEAILSDGAPGRVAELLLRALAALRGNRTITPTFAGEGGRLQRIVVKAAPRFASRLALERVAIEPDDDVLAAFDDVMRAFPGSALPLCHRGEYHFWLGRNEEARADLERVIESHPRTRWAYIGLTGLAIARGDLAGALEVSALGVHRMNDTEGPAVFVYRGEAKRLLGDLEGAIRDLERSVEINPTRVGGWVNLALAHAAAGNTARAREIFARLCDKAPGLMSDAALEADHAIWDGEVSLDVVTAVLARALAMMRGNRASTCVTYVTRRGVIRTAPQFEGSREGVHFADEADLRRLRAQLERSGDRARRAKG